MMQNNLDVDEITVSIIVPIYKAENFIRECIDSILSQTFKNFELILIDDNSPDQCPQICDKYATLDSRIKVIHQKNKGVSAARNAGLEIARGRYIMFCDSDDKVHPKWCQEMISTILEFPDSCVVCDIFKLTQDNKLISPKLKGKKRSITYYDMYMFGLSPFIWNKIYDSNIIQSYALKFNEKCAFGEDAQFNMKYCLACNGKIIYVPTRLYYYRDNPQSLMHKSYSDWMELHFPLFYNRIPLIQEEKLADYCDEWCYRFIKMLDEQYECNSDWTLIKRLRYNQKMLSSKEVQFCFSHATWKKESRLIRNILSKHNYYIYWIFQKFIYFKNRRKQQ